MTHEESRQLRNAIVEYRKQGHYISECAEHFDVKKSYVKQACHGIDYPWIHDTETMSRAAKEQAKNRQPNESTAIEMLKRKASGYEYVSGYTSCEGDVIIRCKTCGAVFKRTYWSIKQGRVNCDNCIELRKEQKAREEEERKARKKIKRITGGTKKPVQMSFKACEGCGRIMIGSNKYCSKECLKRATYARKDAVRRIRVNNQMVDRDITLDRLYQKDEGRCYLCGCLCDWNDCTNDGTFIIGKTYPTIEHVIPLARGGKHAWSNVRLACFSCNTKKGVKMA